MLTDFTPWASLIGGAMIGLAAVLLMALHGRIAGISGIAAGLFPPDHDGNLAGRWAMIAGIVVAPLLYSVVTGAWAPMALEGGTEQLMIAGVLVGFGAVLGNGCTSGHGICGLSRLSVRSLVAVITFMLVAVITVFVMRHVVGA
jgi:uncharacterized protein